MKSTIPKAPHCRRNSGRGIVGGWLLLFHQPHRTTLRVTPITINKAPVAIPTHRRCRATTTQTIVNPGFRSPIPQVDPQRTAPCQLSPLHKRHTSRFTSRKRPARIHNRSNHYQPRPQPTTTINVKSSVRSLAGASVAHIQPNPEIIDESNYMGNEVLATNDGLGALVTS